MDYYCKRIEPRQALKSLGFTDSDNSPGYEIIKYRRVDGFIERRIHAIVVDNRISMHMDYPRKNPGKAQQVHASDGYSQEVRELIARIRAFDFDDSKRTLKQKIKECYRVLMA